MNFGEDVDSHIQREVREETGLAIKPGDPFYIWQWVMRRDGTGGDEVQVVAVARECEASADEVSTAHQQTDDYLEALRWVPIADILHLDLIPSLVPAAEAFVSRHGHPAPSSDRMCSA
jgi:8-oxo-dGTP pyrophosphatase MutT (NUDIX family)